jgi:glycosyltransferase involved in cell wall biosynthesis
MRVVLVGNTAPEDKMGGLPRYVRELARALVHAGVPTTLVVKRVPTAPAATEELAADGVRIIRHSVPSKGNPLFAAAYPVYTARGVLGPVRAVGTGDTVVHGHFAVSALPLVLRGVPYVYTFHAPLWRELLDERQGTYHLPGAAERPVVAGLRMAERVVVSRARRVFVLSEFMRTQLAQLSPRAAAHAELLPGGIDLDKFSPSGTVERATVDAPVLFTARRLTPRTGVDRLVQALPDVLAEHPAAMLAVAGVGEMEPALRALATRLGIAGRVHFLGELSDAELVEWYRRSTLVVVPTIKLEGFGLTIAEALACGTPVIGTPVGAIPELLGALDPGLMADDNSSAALGAAVNRALADPEHLRALGARGRELVAPAMGWEAISRRYLDAYDAVLAQPAR